MAEQTITAGMIKDLRDRTGIGMTQCKSALEEAGGDMELAIANLRKKGLASAVKKEGREAKEGVILSAEKGNVIGIAEVNAETDFSVRNDRFQKFASDIVNEVVETPPDSLELFLKQKYSKEPSITIDEYRATVVQAIGENIQVRRLLTFKKDAQHSIGVYSHLGGKILTVVVLSGTSGEEALAKDIAMHIAAASPEFLTPESVPSDLIEAEKDIAKGQVKDKPANIIDKIVEGKLSAFYDAVCLSRQKFIRDDAISISELVAKRAKEIGKPLALAQFIRWNVGA
jgi:elongation factor Ts